MAWNDGKLTGATITSLAGGPCRILSGEALMLENHDPAIDINHESTVINYDFQKKSGEKVKDYSLEFMTSAGESYVLVPE